MHFDKNLYTSWKATCFSVFCSVVFMSVSTNSGKCSNKKSILNKFKAHLYASLKTNSSFPNGSPIWLDALLTHSMIYKMQCKLLHSHYEFISYPCFFFFFFLCTILVRYMSDPFITASEQKHINVEEYMMFTCSFSSFNLIIIWFPVRCAIAKHQIQWKQRIRLTMNEAFQCETRKNIKKHTQNNIWALITLCVSSIHEYWDYHIHKQNTHQTTLCLFDWSLVACVFICIFYKHVL